MERYQGDLPWGLDVTTGERRYISEVARGRACRCRCEGCGSPLVAKKGGKNVHHFAHDMGYEPCGFTGESALHRLAKEIIAEVGRIWLPEYSVEVRDHDSMGIEHVESELVVESGQYPLSGAVLLERREGSVTPDLQTSLADYPLLVEFACTHFCSDEKIEALRSIGLDTVEIDLSGLPYDLERAELREILLGGGAGQRSRWILHHGEADARGRARARLCTRIREANAQQRLARQRDSFLPTQPRNLVPHSQADEVPSQGRYAPSVARSWSSQTLQSSWFFCSGCRIPFSIAEHPAPGVEWVACPHCGESVSTQYPESLQPHWGRDRYDPSG